MSAINQAQQKKRSEREKLGFNTKLFVKHPFIKGKNTNLFANFVLMDYGTGAIFGCQLMIKEILNLQKNIILKLSKLYQIKMRKRIS